MPQYHRNLQTGTVEQCTATIVCEHGDINTDHVSQPEALSLGDNVDQSLAIFAKVSEIGKLNDSAKIMSVSKSTHVACDEVTTEIASLSYAVGRLSGPETEGDLERFRSALTRCQEVMLAAMQTASSNGESTPLMIELVKATNLLAEVGSRGTWGSLRP